jgi:hypothetical protein
MLALNLLEDWFVLRQNSETFDTIIISREALHFNSPKHIGSQVPLEFKILLVQFWISAPMGET